MAKLSDRTGSRGAWRRVTSAAVIGVLLVSAASASAGLISSLGVTKRTVSGRTTQIVVDRRGDAVYELSGESLSNLRCVTPQCLTTWSPVRVRSAGTKVPVASGVPGPAAVFRRVKGNLYQVMLNHHPLYFFSGDTVGATKGQGIKSFGGTWHIVSAG